MASLVLSGDTSGSITVAAPAVAGSNTQTLVAATGTLAPLISGTAVTASSTSVDFTGIPSWVKRITVMFNAVSTNGTSIPQIQLGDAGGVEITGYAGYSFNPSTAATSATGATLAGQWSAASALYGSCTISLIGSNVWAISFAGSATGLNTICACGYGKTLSDTLDRVRITTVNGTDTFDAGTINILYE